jgi:predicted transcriptional regulator of viral defense system
MDNLSPKTQRTLEALITKRGGFLTHRDVIQAGLDPHVLTKAVKNGNLERVQRGLYRPSNTGFYNSESYFEIHLRVPSAVICLNSALYLHGLTTTQPLELTFAINRRAQAPQIEFPPVHFYRFSDVAFNHGQTQLLLTRPEQPKGLALPIYSPEKTLADLLKYRHKIGLDVFLEGLAHYARGTHGKRPDLNALHQAARVCRVEKIMFTYTQFLAVDTET